MCIFLESNLSSFCSSFNKDPRWRKEHAKLLNKFEGELGQYIKAGNLANVYCYREGADVQRVSEKFSVDA